ncbi:unnamed protein product [Gongylonema pulchrum]|uniref:Uncharacterized protein n=1 Tax=Gongylonema pulchrum TaxID=637853 RepID=A0A183ESD2_9BILA|nr:unnamed protein product [Gongylonema pulchrum]
MYLTDDMMAKQSILRQTQKNGLGCTSEGVYWLKGNNAQSPTTRRVPLNESAKATPEMNRLLGGSTVHRQNSSDENSSPSAAYHTIARTTQPQMSFAQQQQQQHRIVMNSPKYSTEATVSADVVIPANANTFGTLQRNQRPEYVSSGGRQVPQGPRRSSLQNSLNAGIASDGTPLLTVGIFLNTAAKRHS